VTLEGTTYFLVPAAANTTTAPAAPLVAPPAAHFADTVNGLLTDATLTNIDPIFALEAWLAEEDPHISIDWNAPMAMNTETGDYELFADTGANIHISPCCDNFTTFTPIPPHPIKGFQGSLINAMGIGTIVTDKLTQELALYVPNTSVCLLSVLRICQANKYTFHFNNKSASITDASTTVICSGSVHVCTPVPSPLPQTPHPSSPRTPMLLLSPLTISATGIYALAMPITKPSLISSLPATLTVWILTHLSPPQLVTRASMVNRLAQTCQECVRDARRRVYWRGCIST
jgi:hypothetical protein